MRRRREQQRGSQIVEFALIAPILVFLVLSVPILGMIVRSWLVVEAAAREGARVLAIRGDAPAARERAYQEVTLFGGLPTQGGVLFSANDIHMSPNEGIVVVTYRQPTYVPFLGNLMNAGDLNLGPYFVVQGRARFLREGRG